MSRASHLPPTTIQVRLQLIELQYGEDNLDNAGDDLVNCLTAVSDYPNQYQYRFEFDRSHPNDYYHTMNFVVLGIDEETVIRLKKQIQTLGLS